jgi:hypothetical protein
MSLYRAEDERRIRDQALVREWTRSGLLEPEQGARLEAELRVDVRRTNVFLRAGLAFFTAIVIAASVALIAVFFDIDRSLPIAALTAIAAAACGTVAQALVRHQRLYRFGVEEALAMAAAVLFGISAAAFTEAMDARSFGDASIAAGLLAAAAGCLLLFWRFGYVYAAVCAFGCIAAAPFPFHIPNAARHALAAAALAVAFAIARAKRAQHGDDYPGDDYALLQAAAWAGIYLMLNLQLFPTHSQGFFYGFTYAMTWALPAAGLYLAIRDKDRPLLDVSLVMTLISLLTNKAYLQWRRHEWDPIVLGVFLIAAAIGVRRWLSGGVHGQRNGFTAARILDRESGAVTILGTAAAKFHPAPPSFAPPPDDGFGGGRSGGGGATGTY